MSLVALDRMLGVFWFGFARHLWQTALVLLPLFLLARVLRSAPARWSHRLWVAALVKLFVPLAVFGPVAGAAVQRWLAGGGLTPQGGALGGFRVFVTVLGADAASGVTSTVANFPAPFWTGCTVAYLAASCWLIVRTGRDLAAARGLVRADTPVEGERRVKLESAIRLAGVPADRVCVSDANVIPAVVGTIRPRIVLPLRLLDALEVDELTAVLLHEEMHRRNGDTLISLVQRLASSLLFFFPLLAPMQRRLREAAELRCDEDALTAGAEPQAYVRALSRTIRLGLEPSPSPAALGDGNPSIVARRLERLAGPRRTTTMTKHRVAIAAAAIILAAGIFLPVVPATTLAGPEPGIPQLDRLWNRDRLVSLKFDHQPAAKVLEAIAAAGWLHLDTEGAENCFPVSVSLVNVPLKQALEAVAAQIDLRYQVVSGNSLRVTLPSPLPPSEDTTMPHVVTRVEPKYPHDARDARVGGKVTLQAVIREDGTVSDVVVLSNNGLPSLGDAAATAVRQWVYRPAIKAGRPVSASTTVSVEYRLE